METPLLDGIRKAASAVDGMLLTMPIEDLRRLSPEAADARESGKIPMYLVGGPGDSLFGVPWEEAAFVQPTMQQYLTSLVRDATRPVKPKPANTVLEEQERRKRSKEDSEYW